MGMGGVIYDANEVKYASGKKFVYRFILAEVDFRANFDVRDELIEIYRKGSNAPIIRKFLADPKCIPALQKALLDTITNQKRVNKYYGRLVGNETVRPMKPPTGEGTKVLLASGGMDSLLVQRKCGPFDRTLYLDFGQVFIEWELEALAAQGIEAEQVQIAEQEVDEDGVFRTRNLDFLLAVRRLVDGDVRLFMGNNLDDELPEGAITDNNAYALWHAAEAINLMYNGPRFEIYSPLMYFTKKMISLGVLELIEPEVFVRWCEGPDRTPCGECFKCKHMQELGLWDEWVSRIP